MVQQCMCFELERAAMKTVSAIRGRVQSAKNSWRNVSMSTVLGVSSIPLIPMVRARSQIVIIKKDKKLNKIFFLSKLSYLTPVKLKPAGA
jgi:hypothetical protein